MITLFSDIKSNLAKARIDKYVRQNNNVSNYISEVFAHLFLAILIFLLYRVLEYLGANLIDYLDRWLTIRVTLKNQVQILVKAFRVNKIPNKSVYYFSVNDQTLCMPGYDFDIMLTRLILGTLVIFPNMIHVLYQKNQNIMPNIKLGLILKDKIKIDNFIHFFGTKADKRLGSTCYKNR